MVKLEDYITNSSRNIGLGLVSLLGSEWYHSTILSTQFVQVQNFKCSILLYFSTRLTREWEMLILNHELISVDILPPILSSLLFSGLQKLKHHYLRSESHGNNNRSCHEWCWVGCFAHKARSLPMGPGSRLGIDDFGTWFADSSGCENSFISLDTDLHSGWDQPRSYNDGSHCLYSSRSSKRRRQLRGICLHFHEIARAECRCGDWSHGLSKHYGSTPPHVFTAYHDSKQR